MKTIYLLSFCLFSFCAPSLYGQQSTLYYNAQGELTISEIATHYRVAMFDTASQKFVGEVYEYRMDSSLMVMAVYNDAGVLTNYTHFLTTGDTLLKHSDAIQNLPDSIASILDKKESLKQSKYIRKKDYPLIRHLLPPAMQPKNENSPFTIVEEKPTFPGGMSNLSEFLSRFLYYPEEAIKKGIYGRVYVQIVITVDGTLDEIEVIKGIGEGCDEAAIYAVSKLPDWLPGRQHGVPAPVRMVLPITFQ